MNVTNFLAAGILRRNQVQVLTGYSRSTIYLRIKQGLFVKPVRLGSRAVGFPASDVMAIIAARISGKSDAEIQQLVTTCEAARSDATTQTDGGTNGAR